MSETLITLVRHGETEWNASGRWQGQADVPLSAHGVAQAHRLAQRLKHEQIRFDLAYASDLLRAWETALIIGKALDLPIHPLPDLREVHLGAWSGLTTAEIRERFGADYDLVPKGGKRGGHGESDAEFAARVTAGLTKLAADHRGARLLVVTHGGTIRNALTHLIGPIETLSHHIRNTSMTTIVFDGQRWHTQVFNDAAHLETAPESLHMGTL